MWRALILVLGDLRWPAQRGDWSDWAASPLSHAMNRAVGTACR